MDRIHNKKIVFGVIRITVVTILMVFCIYFVRRFGIMSVNKTLIEEQLNDSLSYTTEDRAKDYRYLDSLLEREYLTDNQKGIVYEKLANLCMLDGSIYDYYTYVGHSLYYSNKAGNDVKIGNVYCNLASFFLSNGSYDKAKEMLDNAKEHIDNVDDYLLASEYYRFMGQYYMSSLKNYDKAHQFFEKSMGLLADAKPEHMAEEYYAMTELQDALCYVYEGENTKASSILVHYSRLSIDEAKSDGAYWTRGYQIPYIKAQIMLAAESGNYETEMDLLHLYLQYCNQYGLFSNLVDMVYFYQTQNIHVSEIEDDTHRMLFEGQMAEAFRLMSSEYTNEMSNLLYLQVQNTVDLLERENRENVAKMRRIATYTSVVIILLGISIFFYFYFKKISADSLTGLGNRRAFENMLEDLTHRGQEISAIMFDLDDFKKVNDTYGHEMGDYVLQEFGAIVRCYQSNMTFPYRYGGEEFVILTYFHDSRSVLEMAEDIRLSVQEHEWKDGLKITVSCGVALHVLPDTVVSDADENLYFTKHHGKNGVCYRKNGIQKLYK